MKLLERLREPEVLTYHTSPDDEIDALMQGPPVTLVADLMVRRHPELVPAALKQWGYRPMERRPEMRATQYVRPLPLWMSHKAGHGLYLGYWNTLRWLFQQRVIRIASPKHTMVRFRDLRPWFMAGRGYDR